LSATLNGFAGANPDAADTLNVNLAESGGVLSSGTALDAQLGNTLCIVDSELVSYETATLAAASQYALTTLYRGLYGTAAVSHASGASFARLDNAAFEYDLPAQYVGKTLYIKLQSFNVFGGGLQDISTCAVYNFTPSGVAIDHPIGESILVNASMDFGAVTAATATADDFGASFSLFVELDLDLGLA
jgi:hypothetical protein